MLKISASYPQHVSNFVFFIRICSNVNFLAFWASFLILSGRAIFASFYPPCKLLHENFVAHFQSLMHEMEIFLGYYFEM